jgi:hypothetical protein
MLIGMVGFIGSGKGTVGDILVNKYGFKKDAYANPLKDCVATIFGWDREMLEGSEAWSRLARDQEEPFWTKRIGSMTPRRALQLMGTEAGRNVFHKDIWLYALERRLDLSKDYVITDVRFKNEIEFIHKLGGVVVRIKRGHEPLWYDRACATNNQLDLPRHESMDVEPYDNVHVSEWDWCGHDLITECITNEGTLAELEIKVDKLVDSYRSKAYTVSL